MIPDNKALSIVSLNSSLVEKVIQIKGIPKKRYSKEVEQIKKYFTDYFYIELYDYNNIDKIKVKITEDINPNLIKEIDNCINKSTEIRVEGKLSTLYNNYILIDSRIISYGLDLHHESFPPITPKSDYSKLITILNNLNKCKPEILIDDIIELGIKNNIEIHNKKID